ncbi:DUF2147 domain-containing protein [Ruegeria sp.]|uniref:DUF2147 domain-containing protein n=1 Tax=Ruegeria sp. TaxID=1879320 RepID=UPI003B5B0878
MKRILTTAAVLGLSAMPALADITGKWKSEANDEGLYIIVDIQPCGAGFCGSMTETNAEDGAPVGTQIIKDMVSDGENEFSGGKIYAPDTERWYNGNLELKSNGQLKVAGCVLGGIICRSQNWTKQ